MPKTKIDVARINVANKIIKDKIIKNIKKNIKNKLLLILNKKVDNEISETILLKCEYYISLKCEEIYKVYRIANSLEKTLDNLKNCNIEEFLEEFLEVFNFDKIPKNDNYKIIKKKIKKQLLFVLNTDDRETEGAGPINIELAKIIIKTCKYYILKKCRVINRKHTEYESLELFPYLKNFYKVWTF
uniref:Uncharacterized protein n=1 Tax=viral metagenome TaxID=1070528 RepID=A0A6C0ADJ6_9ZZZZ